MTEDRLGGPKTRILKKVCDWGDCGIQECKREKQKIGRRKEIGNIIMVRTVNRREKNPLCQ